MPFNSRTALRAPSQPATQAAVHVCVVRSACLSVTRDAIGCLLEGDELGVPLHRHVPVAQLLPHDPFVIVLAENEDIRVRSYALACFAQRNPRSFPAFRPDVGARAVLAELEGTVDDPELGVDLERARLYTQRPCLECRPRMAVYDRRAHTPPAELIGQHQAGRTGADNEDIGIRLTRLTHALPRALIEYDAIGDTCALTLNPSPRGRGKKSSSPFGRAKRGPRVGMRKKALLSRGEGWG